MINFTIIENDIMCDKISDGAFRLYSILKSYCFGNKTTCFPSEITLASKMRKSVRTIQRYIKELIKASLITKKRRGSISNIYEILRKTAENKIEAIKVNAAERKNNSAPNKTEHSTYGKKKSTSIFNDYEQRNYNFTNLEAMLLGRDGVTFEDCLVTK